MNPSTGFLYEEFSLDTLLVIQHHGELGNSSNKPMLARGINSTTGIKEDIVIKLMASERMSKDACLKECVASLMALSLDIFTPRPSCAFIERDFIDSRRGYPDYSRYANSHGLNFCTIYNQSLEEIYPLYLLPGHLRTEALRIYAFDLIIQNVDRGLPPGKPNLFTDHHHLYVLDHELAFAFLDLFFVIEENPWEFGEEGLSSAKSHILYQTLKHKQLDFNSLNGMLTPISSQFWHEIRRILPLEWQDENRLLRIEEHVTAIRDHEAEFINGIKSILK